MFDEEDKTYYKLREKSVMKWLDGLRVHRDVEVRGGVEITIEYIESLQKKIKYLEDKNLLKNKYLKKMKDKTSR